MNNDIIYGLKNLTFDISDLIVIKKDLCDAL